MRSCTIELCKWFCFDMVLKADLRISIKDYHRNKNLKVLLFRSRSQGLFCAYEWKVVAGQGRPGVPDASNDRAAEVARAGGAECRRVGVIGEEPLMKLRKHWV